MTIIEMPAILVDLETRYEMEPLEDQERTLPAWALPRESVEDRAPSAVARFFELFPAKGALMSLALYVAVAITVLTSTLTTDDVMAPLWILTAFSVFLVLEDGWARMGRFVEKYGRLVDD